MSDVVYKASLDDKEVLKALQRIDKNIERIADGGDKAFNNVEKASKRSGIQIGAVSGVVQELTRRFIDLGIKGAKALGDLAAKGIDLNKKLEISGLVFSNVFGDPKLGQATLDFLDETADRLRIDEQAAVSFGERILPRTSSLETFTELLRLTDIQADTTGKTIDELEFSIREALSGDFVSIRDRFDLSKDAINRIKELGKEIGLDNALAQVLNEEFVKLGKVNLTGTLATDLKDIQSRFVDLNKALGVAPFEELKEQAADFLDLLDRRGGDLERIAKAFGDLAAKATELFGGALQDLLENLDADEVEEIADNFKEMLDATKLLADILTDPELLNNILTGTNAVLEALRKALITGSQLVVLSKAQLAKERAEAEFLAPSVAGVLGEVDPTAPGFLLVAKAIASQEDLTKAAAAGQEAYNETIRDAIPAFDDYNDRLDENAQKEADRTKETEKSSKADRDAIDAALRRKAALEQLEQASAEAEEAQKRINEEQADFARDLQESLTKIQIDAERDRLDDLVKNAQKREDIARKNAQEIEDIFRDHNQEIEDAARDLGRADADIARKAARDRQSVERDLANSRIDIERDLRQELLRIQQQFNQDAEEAERNNDAQAFLRAVRSKDAQIEQAQTRRDENIQQAEIEGERRREELQRQLQFEIEDAKISNQRKLEDLQISLERELEEQRIELERELEQQRIAEERQAAERQLALERALADFARANALKREDLQRSLEEELKLVQAFESAKADVAIAEAKRAAETIRAIRESIMAPFSGGSGSSAPYIPVITRHQGGPVEPGQPYVVKPDEEVVVFDQPGTIVPNTQLFAPPVQSFPLQQISSINSTSANASFQMTDFQSMMNDPVARSTMRDFVMSVFAELGL